MYVCKSLNRFLVRTNREARERSRLAYKIDGRCPVADNRLKQRCREHETHHLTLTLLIITLLQLNVIWPSWGCSMHRRRTVLWLIIIVLLRLNRPSTKVQGHPSLHLLYPFNDYCRRGEGEEEQFPLLPSLWRLNRSINEHFREHIVPQRRIRPRVQPTNGKTTPGSACSPHKWMGMYERGIMKKKTINEDMK